MNRIIGAILFLTGLLLTILYPDLTRYQSPWRGGPRDVMGYGGIVIGIALIVIGIYLMKS